MELKSHPQSSFLARPTPQLWPLPHGALIHTLLSFLDPSLATSPATPFSRAPPLSASTQPRPPESASHPSGAPPGGGEGGGGARSSSGPKVAPRARTAGPGAGARPATRPRCWSRKRSVSAWCSGSVGGSKAGPTGPAASADRWPGLNEPGLESACPMPSPARASLQIYPAGLGVPRPQPRVSRGALAAPAGSLSHHLTGLPHPTAPHHSGTSLWVQGGYLGPRRAQGGGHICPGQVPFPLTH